MGQDFLNKLGFTAENGLVRNLDEAQNHVERLYIEEVQRLPISADAVFFRRFYQQNQDDTPYSSVPAVCVFRQSDAFFNTEKHKELHAALWSSGKTEIYLIQGETRIDLINARKPATRISDDDVSLEELRLVESLLEEFDDQRFSAHLFGSGTFWEQNEFKDKIDVNSNPYTFLLDYLMQARGKLQKADHWDLTAHTIDKLLITCILVKFLEEIKDDNGKHTLKGIYRKYGVKTFEEALQYRGVCVKILGDLAKEFNGKIFNTFTQEELEKIAQSNLIPIAHFLRADIDLTSHQLFIWKQYSFNHLPAEVISAIYENFIQAEAERNGEKKKGVVYTPLHLVDLLIDEIMPLDQPELFRYNRFRVLDPACGSGVFLVAAYKRMLQWWTINHWKETDQITYPDKETAKQILEDNIFGVDVEEVAALVSIFGLTTAFLDKLTPKEIWNNLKFQDLSKQNIQGISFVDWAKSAKARGEQFDLVIGNPPFNPSQKGDFTNQDLLVITGKKVPGNKLALKFLETALVFGKKVCMIIPSNVFLYNKSKQSHAYRKEVFTNHTVEKIYDFTHLRESLFVKKTKKQGATVSQKKTGRTPVIALILLKQPSEKQLIEHTVVKREILSEQKMRFEIDYYDKHQVRWDWAIDEKKHFVWKTNLLGGGQLFHLVYRLSLLETLGEFIEEKKSENAEWIFEVGYEAGNPKQKKLIPYLHNQDKVVKIGKDGTIKMIEIERNQYFYRSKVERLFQPPFVIINKKMGEQFLPIGIVKNYAREYLIFNSSYVGIHAPKNNFEELVRIFRYIKNNESFCLFWLLIQSPSALINQETSFKKKDLEILPFISNEKYLTSNKKESILKSDLLSYNIHLGKAITPKSTGKILHDPIPQEELQAFGNTYCDALNDIYATDVKSWQAGQVLQTPTFISYQFGFGRNGGLKHELKESTEQAFHSLLTDLTSNKGAIHSRIIREYKHIDGYDCVYMIKPKARRYWLQSIALRDADDTFIDLKKAGY